MKTPRKHCLWTLPLLALIPLASLAAPPASTSIAIDCERPYISHRDAARVLHTDNFSQTYAKRQSLYANVARRCHDGVEQVLLVASERQPRPRTLATR